MSELQLNILGFKWHPKSVEKVLDGQTSQVTKTFQNLDAYCPYFGSQILGGYSDPHRIIHHMNSSSVFQFVYCILFYFTLMLNHKRIKLNLETCLFFSCYCS